MLMKLVVGLLQGTLYLLLVILLVTVLHCQ